MDLKEFKTRVHEMFGQLDEWLGAKYQTEIDSIKALVGYFKDLIESEKRLHNELVLEGDMFIINQHAIHSKPILQQRTESPIDEEGKAIFNSIGS